MLLKTWRKVLGISNIGIRDNFFDLGGHSLLSARLLSEVEKMAGREIPLSALFRGGTVESLAQIIREGSESIPEPVVMEIQVGTGGLPFFAVAPPGAESLGFALLARHMGPDQTVYKLQASEASTDDRPFTEEELHALSAEYIAAMRAVQPEGPYCLGGMCEGVHIAEKMVLDLEAQGQEVGVFAIFDTWVMQNSLRPWPWRMAYYRQRLRMLRTKTFADQLHAFKKAMQTNVRSLLKSRRLAIRAEWQHLYWPQNFRPKRFRAPVMLFKRPKQPFYYVEDPEMGWAQRSSGGVQVYEIDFNHLKILREPHIRVLGDKLAAGIRRVSERANNSRRNQQAETPSDTVLLSTRV
jgi:thioesterase domain-containing protein/acyl carrier protein